MLKVKPKHLFFCSLISEMHQLWTNESCGDQSTGPHQVTRSSGHRYLLSKQLGSLRSRRSHSVKYYGWCTTSPMGGGHQPVESLTAETLILINLSSMQFLLLGLVLVILVLRGTPPTGAHFRSTAWNFVREGSQN